MPSPEPKKIFVIAGEASGDLHGANLIKSIVAQAKEPVEIYGVGGDQIRETGAREFFDLAHFHVTGITEALIKIPQYKKAELTILSSIRRTRPQLVVLIDNPGFNLHLAKEIHAMGISIVYYIAPQVWAWGERRIFKIKRTVKKVLVVFEFEKKLYEDQGIPVSWVGHPLRDLVESSPSSKKTGETVVSLLPGSRAGEVKTLLGLFLKAARLIQKEIPQSSFQVIQSPTLSKDFYDPWVQKEKKTGGVRLSLVEKDSYPAIERSDLAIVCSGTATLECALLGTPMIICNRAGVVTYLFAKSLIKVPYLGLPNLILGDQKMPELLQYNATPEKIAQTALRILQDKEIQATMRADLAKVKKQLGEKGAAKRAAEEVLSLLQETAKV